jgi:hypothetical protein
MEQELTQTRTVVGCNQLAAISQLVPRSLVICPTFKGYQKKLISRREEFNKILSQNVKLFKVLPIKPAVIQQVMTRREQEIEKIISLQIDFTGSDHRDNEPVKS